MELLLLIYSKNMALAMFIALKWYHVTNQSETHSANIQIHFFSFTWFSQ